MERWSLVISGFGPHHSGQDTDAEKIAGHLLQALRESGHEIDSAKFVARGSEEAVEDPAPPPPPVPPIAPSVLEQSDTVVAPAPRKTLSVTAD